MQRKEQYNKVILILMVVSFMINIALIVYLFGNKQSDNVVGTYCTGDGKAEGDRYIVLQEDGIYTIYEQFKRIETGEYMLDHDDVYTLKEKESDYTHNFIYSNGKVFYWEKEDVLVFDKISSKSMYINVP